MRGHSRRPRRYARAGEGRYILECMLSSSKAHSGVYGILHEAVQYHITSSMSSGTL